ncbi:MAG: ubiquinol cytochrome C oxidoreductase, partial [Cyclobacteriaceae bacterium]
SYQWGTNYFGFLIYGAGVNLDFIYVVAQLLFYSALMVSMYWVRNRTIYHTLLGVWFINFFGNLIADIVINGDTMFNGDTLNVHISITWIVLPLSFLALILIFLVIRADKNADEQLTSWTVKNRTLLIMILGPLPIQAILFAAGEPHGITDQIGVIISIIQCFLIPIILRPQLIKSKTTVSFAD